jgi:hypothetical protein
MTRTRGSAILVRGALAGLGLQLGVADPVHAEVFGTSGTRISVRFFGGCFSAAGISPLGCAMTRRCSRRRMRRARRWGKR